MAGAHGAADMIARRCRACRGLRVVSCVNDFAAWTPLLSQWTAAAAAGGGRSREALGAHALRA
jgi:hypothetical protein